MKCSRVRENLSRFLDNDCDAELAADIAEHVASCSQCRVERDALGSIRTALQTGSRLPGADEARNRVFMRLERAVRDEDTDRTATSARPGWRLPRITRRPIVVGLAAAAVAGIFLIVPLRDTATPPVDVTLPGPAEMMTLFHLHDAHGAALTADEPLIHRDTAAEARAALLGDAGDAVAGSL